MQGRLPSVGSSGGVHHCLAALVYAEPVLETQLRRDVGQSSDFFVDDVLHVLEVEFLHVLQDSHELALEMRVVGHRSPDVINHLFFLRCQHPPIEIMRVYGRHQHDSISIEVILGEIGTMPYFNLPVLIESNQGLIDGKSSKPPIQLIEANECLTEHIETLLVAEILDISQPIRNILSEHLDVLVIGAEILLGLVISLIHLDYRLIAHIPKVISLKLFLLIQPRVIEYHMLLSDDPLLILVDLVVIISPEEVPAERRDGV